MTTDQIFNGWDSVKTANDIRSETQQTINKAIDKS
jgi:hypothetical protein